MPEICRFLGIIIYMYFNEHNPPHFHAVYNEHRASIAIETLGIVEGKLPSRVLSLVVEWAQENKQELFENWNALKSTGKFKKLKPLV